MMIVKFIVLHVCLSYYGKRDSKIMSTQFLIICLWRFYFKKVKKQLVSPLFVLESNNKNKHSTVNYYGFS